MWAIRGSFRWGFGWLLFYRQSTQQTSRLLRRIYRFLGVDPSYAQKALKRKVNARAPQEMPASAATHLARCYHEDLQIMSERFGGYASFWLYCAERLVNDPIDGKIAYPLWNSWLWKEWKNRPPSDNSAFPRKGRVQSGAIARRRLFLALGGELRRTP